MIDAHSCILCFSDKCLFIYFRCRGKGVIEGDIVTFSASAKNSGDIQQYLSQVVCSVSGGLASQLSHLPTVIVVDNLQHIASLADVFRTFLLAKPASWFVAFTVYCMCS